MPNSPSFFYKKLIYWYLQNKRELPWRTTTQPYFIWLSEIILQQTRVNQGIPYYLKFVKSFPTIEILANASEENVLKLWQGLGYYSRARNLHLTARYITNQLNGVFPKNYKELIKLKGLVDYTASAISSVWFNEPRAVVDGNVYRVLARVFGIDIPINSSRGINEFKNLAQQLVDTKQPGIYNQAIMEFGARYCVPQNPNCNTCIFNDRCIAFQKQLVSELPVKLPKTSIINFFFNYIVIISEDDKTVLRQRTEKGIWQKLYAFPLLDPSNDVILSQIMTIPMYLQLSQQHRL